MVSKKFAITTLILSICLMGFSQDYGQDIGKIITEISKSDHYQISSQINVFDNPTSKQLQQSFSAEVRRSALGYRSRIDDTEIISNDKMVIMIDHEEHYIQIENQQKMSRKDEELMQEIYEMNEKDSLLKKIDFISSIEQINTYKLYMSGEISTVIISLNMLTLTIQKIEYFYDEKRYPSGNYVVIKYNKFDYKHAIDDDLINGIDVLAKVGKNFVAKGKCESYQIVNLYQD